MSWSARMLRRLRREHQRRDLTTWKSLADHTRQLCLECWMPMPLPSKAELRAAYQEGEFCQEDIEEMIAYWHRPLVTPSESWRKKDDPRDHLS